MWADSLSHLARAGLCGKEHDEKLKTAEDPALLKGRV